MSVLKSDHRSNGHLLHGAAVLSGRGTADGRVLANGFSFAGGVLHCGGLTEASKRVVRGKLLKLDGGVLVQELIDGEVTSTNTDVDLVLVNSDSDSLGSELVDTIGLSHEHDLQLLSVGEVVDVLSKSNINSVSLNWDVDGDAGLQVDDVLLEGVNLELSRLKAFEELNLDLADLEVLPFKLLDVEGAADEFFLQVFFDLEHLLLVVSTHAELFFNVMEHSQFTLESRNGSAPFLQIHVEGVTKISKSGVFIAESIVISDQISLKFSPLSSLSLMSSIIFSDLSLECFTGQLTLFFHCLVLMDIHSEVFHHRKLMS